MTAAMRLMATTPSTGCPLAALSMPLSPVEDFSPSTATVAEASSRPGRVPASSLLCTEAGTPVSVASVWMKPAVRRQTDLVSGDAQRSGSPPERKAPSSSRRADTHRRKSCACASLRHQQTPAQHCNADCSSAFAVERVTLSGSRPPAAACGAAPSARRCSLTRWSAPGASRRSARPRRVHVVARVLAPGNVRSTRGGVGRKAAGRWRRSIHASPASLACVW